MKKIGIDLGGTKIEGVLIDQNADGTFTEVRRMRVPTEREKGYDAILEKITSVVEVMRSAAGERPPVGIGTPGSVRPDSGHLEGSNTVVMNGKPVLEDLEARLHQKIHLENDANCFALAEARAGAGRGHRMVFGVIVGTGCGGGLILDGKIWTGRHAIGGEWGHMKIDPLGPDCYCGHRGCVETLISGGGLERRWKAEHGASKSLPDIFRDYRSGGAAETAFVTRFFDDYGRSLANLINALDPDCIVLGGGLSQEEDLTRQGYEAIRRYAFTKNLRTPILKHALGDSAGVFGAAMLA